MLRFPKLDKDSLSISVYSDASFCNNQDGSSQLGYIILLKDKENKCQPLYWSSHKSRRSSRSVLGSEVMAFADAFDMAFTIKYDMQMIMKQYIPLNMYTDSLSLFDVLTKSTTTTEKRLMIDLRSVRECYENQELDNVAHIRSQFNPADSLTKIKRNSILDQILSDGKIHHPVDQWIMRETAINQDMSGDKKNGEC